MSVRSNASGDKLYRLASPGIQTLTRFTILGWAYFNSFRTDWQYFAGFESGTSNAGEWILMGLHADDDSLHINAQGLGYASFSQNPVVQTWFPFAVGQKFYSETQLNGFFGYWKNIQTGYIYETELDTHDTWANKYLDLLNDSYDEWCDMRLSNVKVYNRALTREEINREWSQFVPVDRRHLYAWYPFSGSTTKDLFGGNTLTVGGTLDLEADPPIPWEVKTPVYWQLGFVAENITSGTQAIYLSGFSPVVTDSQPVYLKGTASTTDTQSIYLKGSVTTTDTQAIFLTSIATITDTQSVYLKGLSTLTDTQAIYFKSELTSTDTQSIYLKAESTSVDTQSIYLKGSIDVIDTQAIFLTSISSIVDTQSLYLKGLDSLTDTQSVYLKAENTSLDTQAIYIKSSSTLSDTQSLFLSATSGEFADTQSIYLSGATFFPFTDDFTGTNNDPWNLGKWLTEVA